MAYKFPTYTAVPGMMVAEEGGMTPPPAQPVPPEPAMPAPAPEAPATPAEPQMPAEGMPSGN